MSRQTKSRAAASKAESAEMGGRLGLVVRRVPRNAADADAENVVELLLYDEIGQWWEGSGVTAKEIVEQLKAAGDVDHIILRINSPGGSVYEGFAIYNALVQHAADVETRIDGLAASAASVVAMAGDTITMSATAMMMIHEPINLVIGGVEELRSAAEELEKLARTIGRVYAARSGQDLETVREWMRNETWFDADDAIEAGLATEQYELKEAAAVFGLDRYADTYRHIPAGLFTGEQDGGKRAGRGGPASNTTGRRGAINARGAQGDGAMNEKLRQYLETIGLKAGASEKDAIAFWNTREDVEKEIADALAVKAADKAGDKAGDRKPAEPPKRAEDPPAVPADVDGRIRDAIAADRKANGERLEALREVAGQVGLDRDWVDDQFSAGTAVDEARKLALEHAAAHQPFVGTGGAGDVRVGSDRARSGLGDAISDAICLRAGRPLITIDAATGNVSRDAQGRIEQREPHERASAFQRLPLVEMGRQWLAINGLPDAQEMSRSGIAELMVSRAAMMRRFGAVAVGAQSTSDFPYILQDAMGKSLRAAYEEAPKTHTLWTRRGTAPDFKTIKRLTVSEAPNLISRIEGAEVQYGTLSETRETYALVEYAKGIRLTRKAIINDDLDAFGRIPSLQAAAAARLEDTVVYAVLTGNAAMADGVALFAGAHGNYVAAGAGAAPCVTTLNTMRGAMRIQQGVGAAAYLNLAPRFLIGPAALEGTILQLLASEADPAATYGHAKNIWRGALNPVIESRLDAASTTGWYAACDPNQYDTVEISFLEDEQAPVLKSETDFETDDAKFVVRHTVAAKAIDYRGLFYNAGV